MSDAQESQTHVTLLARLARSGEADEGAWREFVNHYGRKIYRWCLHWNLQEADARDVTQQVLLKMARYMRTFVYDPSKSFRAWLKTVARHALLDFQNTWRRPDRGTGDSRVQEQLDSVEAGEDLIRHPKEQYDHELLEQATIRVRLRVASHTWEAFQLTAMDGIPAAEAAARLNMKIATVYEARSSVLKKLKEERKSLEFGQHDSATQGKRSDRE
ncbi:sigma-70 family RNA polymerase sigma factor [soil metagenome]